MTDYSEIAICKNPSKIPHKSFNKVHETLDIDNNEPFSFLCVFLKKKVIRINMDGLFQQFR